jgi:hypothetical protein
VCVVTISIPPNNKSLEANPVIRDFLFDVLGSASPLVSRYRIMGGLCGKQGGGLLSLPSSHNKGNLLVLIPSSHNSGGGKSMHQ